MHGRKFLPKKVASTYNSNNRHYHKNYKTRQGTAGRKMSPVHKITTEDPQAGISKNYETLEVCRGCIDVY